MNSRPVRSLRKKEDVKIFILYLMENLGCPLTFQELHDIAVSDEFVSSIAFSECFSELLDTGNLRKMGCPTDRPDSSPTDRSDGSPAGNPAGGPDGLPPEETLYEITDQGRVAASSLQSQLLRFIRDRSLQSALRILSFRRDGGGIHTEQTLRGDGRFDVTCSAIDRNGSETLRVTVIADSAERAELIRENFNERPEHIYRAIFALLSGDANFLFDL